MKYRIAVLATLLVAAGIVVFLYARRQPREVSMILTNAVVYTVNPSHPRAEAVAIKNGIIVGVGTAADIRESFVADTVIDLHGKALYPGFIDSHAHLEGLGIFLMNLDLVGTRSPEEIKDSVAAQIARRPQGAWIRGRGWDQNDWKVKEFPRREVLDAVSPNNPVMLARVDGHAVWVNSVALRLAKVDRNTPDPDGGRIIRDAHGEPTGVFVDNAVLMLNAVLPAPTVEERTEAVRLAVNECLRYGLTQVHDMGVDQQLIGIYRSLIEKQEFPFRVYAAIDGTGETWDKYRTNGPDTGDREGRLTVRSLKVYMDGALGSRGAALLEPYADEPGNRGLTLMSSDSLQHLAQECLKAGFQLCVHAIGDRANSIVLSAYEKALKSNNANGNDVRFRVEHAQILEPRDVKRFHDLGILPMMQPTHCTSDMPWVESRLGKRASEGYVWRSLLDDGNIVPGGSDFPVESPNPLLGFYAAVTRQDVNGMPPGGWYPDQRMTRDEALKAFTLWSSYAAFEEEKKGSIEVGKWADLVVLSEDIMTIEPRRIPGVRVEKTILAGKIVYEAGSAVTRAGE